MLLRGVNIGWRGLVVVFVVLLLFSMAACRTDERDSEPLLKSLGLAPLHVGMTATSAAYSLKGLTVNETDNTISGLPKAHDPRLRDVLVFHSSGRVVSVSVDVDDEALKTPEEWVGFVQSFRRSQPRRAAVVRNGVSREDRVAYVWEEDEVSTVLLVSVFGNKMVRGASKAIVITSSPLPVGTRDGRVEVLP
jgi:hypothetical protein